MKRLHYAMLVLCVAATTVACRDAGAPYADRTPSAPPGTPGAAGTSGAAESTVSAPDRNFVSEMLSGNQAEVELGQLAQRMASNQRVKDFGAMIVRDHQKANADLKTAAREAKIELPATEPDSEKHKDVQERLAKLSGMEFDREYMKEMVEGHEKAVEAIEDKTEGNTNDHVKQWALTTLPIVKKHLDEAKEIHGSLEKRSGT
jgi:putative membrane protein